MNAGKSNRLQWFGWATVGWTAAWCFHLGDSWNHAPYDRAGWGAAALWTAALVCQPRAGQPVRLLLAAAWFGSLIGVIGALHVAQHMALVCAVCACLQGTCARVTAAVTALSWMPALGWLLAALSPAMVNSVRLFLAAALLGSVLLRRFRVERLAA